jgi:toxin ParE1/3/4
MATYKLKISRRAEQQLEELYLDGFRRWGEKQTDDYYDKLIIHIALICETPSIFMSVDSIRAGYRRSVCGKHSIYYRIINNSVEIMGVLKKQNQLNNFDQDNLFFANISPP